jgi:hypothetical protein
MELSYIIFEILLNIGVSIGMGTSTLAILNFFHAINDGVISETERNFMGITYTVLRVAMGIILSMLIALSIVGYNLYGLDYFTHYVVAQVFLTFILFLNSALMTLRIMPSTFGPGIQASTWYTLGFVTTVSQYVPNLNSFVFILGYLTVVIFATSLVNAVMAYIKDNLARE